MKKVFIALFVFSVLFSGCSKKTEDIVDVKKSSEVKKKGKYAEDIEVISYRMGFETALTTRKNFQEADPNVICQGVKDAFEKPFEPKYNDNSFNRSLARYQKDRISVDAEKRLGETLKNRPLSEKFIKENSSKPGIKTLEKGVLFQVIKEGAGDKITIHDIVEVKYQGWDVNGKLFDSSIKRGRNSKFNLNNLVKGLQISMVEMKKGGQYKVYLPEDTGYGSKGFKDRVEGGMALLFEFEIINISKNAVQNITEKKEETAIDMEKEHDNIKKN